MLILCRFICYVGISYQLPGSFGGERANLLTAHLKVMGLLDSARIMWAHPSTLCDYMLTTCTQLLAYQHIFGISTSLDHRCYHLALPHIHGNQHWTRHCDPSFTWFHFG